MTRTKRLTGLILAGAMAIGLLTGCQSGGGTPSAGDASPEQPVDITAIEDFCQYAANISGDAVVATVNETQITAQELLYWVALYCDDILSNYGLTEVPWDTALEGQSMTEFLLEHALNSAAVYHLMEQKAKEEGLSVSQEDQDTILASLKEIREDQEAQGLSARTYLQQFILTPDLYVWYCQCECLISELANAHYGVTTSNYPTDEKVIAFLEETYGLYSTKHILKASLDTTTRQPLDAETVAKKKAQAEDLLRQLQASDEPLSLFDTLMQQHSEDPGLKSSPEGYLAVAPGEFDSAYEKAALALEEGQISGVVEGASGFHIILRLPLGIDPEPYREVYVEAKMAEERTALLEQAQIQTREQIQTLDLASFYQAVTAFREELAARTVGSNKG